MRPLVIKVENTTTGEQHLRAFHKSPVHIGRNELNDLPIQNGYVSLWHAVARFDEDGVRYTDLGSTNGSEVNGARVESNKATGVGESNPVRIGELWLYFSRDEALAEQADREPAGTLFAKGDAADVKPAEATSTQVFQSPHAMAAQKLVIVREEAPVVPIQRYEKPDPAPPKPVVSVARGAEGAVGKAAAAGGPEKLVSTLLPTYVRFRDAWKELRLELTHGLKELRKEDRSRALDLVREQMPQVLKEEEFQVMLIALGIASRRSLGAAPSGDAPAATPTPPVRPVPTPAEGAPSDVASKLLARFARSYAPGGAFQPPADGEKLLERVADVMETCAKMYVELRKGHGQFAEHMALRSQPPQTPLARAQDGREVLAYVMNWREGRARVDELRDGFKEFMVHEIALLQGLRAGVRELLESLSPQKVTESSGPSLLGPVTHWRRYVELYEDLAEEQTLTRKLFGGAFWRAYSAVAQESE